jgi:hypothetical protein
MRQCEIWRADLLRPVPRCHRGSMGRDSPGDFADWLGAVVRTEDLEQRFMAAKGPGGVRPPAG